MKRAVITAAAGIALALFQPVANAEVDAKWAQAKAKEHGCLNCRAIEKKKVGPSFESLGKKYKGKAVGDAVGSMTWCTGSSS